MKTEIQTFNFNAGENVFALRVVLRDGAPWFVSADVCAALGIANNRDALERLDDDERGVGSIDTLGGTQSMSVVNEPGLYSLILGSRKPEAKPFKRWVTHEVLPAIARTGAYVDIGNQMGETLGKATADHIGLPASDLGLVAHGLLSITEALNAIDNRLNGHIEREEARDRRERERDRANARHIDKLVRINKAQKPSNKNLDPNRPLSEEDIEKFKYLVSVGTPIKQICRNLNRTYEAIRRFIDQNNDLVLRAMQQSLL